MKKISELGQSAVAITDHGVMYGVVDFYKEAKKNNIKPIIGCEVYICDDINDDNLPPSSRQMYHLILLCKNKTGYENLCKMVSISFTKGFYKKPRIDKKMLAENSKGLIALSACLAGEIPSALLLGDDEKARDCALFYKNIFKDDFYIEVQNHGLDEQKKILPKLINLASDLDIELVATNDCHYVDKKDAKMQEILTCIQTGKTLSDENRMKMGSDEFYIKSSGEMEYLFKDTPSAISNTVKIAEKCDFDFEFGQTKLPRFDLDEDISHFEYLKKLCDEGIKKRYGDNPSAEIFDRTNYELDTIEKMGYTDYFLIVRDFIIYAKNKGIPVGPGRGSGAGSIVAFEVGITDIDPIKYGLLFERFLNPERVSMPDFDVDFCYERRQEVIDYVNDKYGADHVAQIVTFGTMAARGAIRDVGRVLGMPYADVDVIAKAIPRHKYNITLDEALEDKSALEFQQMYRENLKAKELIDLARQIEGMPRNTSTHAAGVVITDKPVLEYVPLAKNGDMTVTQYTMGTLEQLGLLKIDFLGLRTLTVIHDAQEMIRRKNPDFDIEKISLDDEATFRMLQKGDSNGVFQFESDGMKKVLIRVVPTCIEDLIASISLYRPGAAKSIDPYVESRKDPKKVTYDTPQLESILSVTNGCLVYQEQVMEVFRKLGGYSYGRADIVRRAMSKKKADVLEKERETFTEGAVKNGVDRKIAEKLFNRMSDFASYAFNKSHAAAYATVAYRTAYLKCHYPDEFMAALLTSVLDYTPKLTFYIEDCKENGIDILPPSVVESNSGFSVTDKGKIRFGLLAIKNLGRGLINKIIKEREISPFKDFYDFCERMYGLDFNRRALECLIKAGALDSLAKNRRQMMESMDEVLSHLDESKRNVIKGQIGFFDSPDIFPQSLHPKLKDVEEYEKNDLLKMEKFVAGIYISGHPVSDYNKYYPLIKATKIRDLLADETGEFKFKDGDNVTLIGVISELTIKLTKSNTSMAFINLSDTSGNVEVLVFPKILSAFADEVRDENVIILKGKVSVKDDKIQIICEKIYNIATIDSLIKSEKTLYIKTESGNLDNIKSLLTKLQKGDVSVKIYFDDTKKTVLYKSKLHIGDAEVSRLKSVLGDDNVILK
jgi:DNA polymerase-3 subunit alpha